ncbi:MAG: DUF1156 domain-containing protein, partial [Thermomicrobiales bacterium]
QFKDYFTERQLVALTTFSDLVGEARERVLADSIEAGLTDDGVLLDNGGTEAAAYADAVATYLALGVSRMSDISNALCRWESSKTQVRNLFGRQAIPMVWDFAEPNVFAGAAGDFLVSLNSLCRVIDRFMVVRSGFAKQLDATQVLGDGSLLSTDPPYYDNIGYADLSDFFYVWLRKTLDSVFPNLFQTLLVPKAEELVATTYRFDGRKAEAEKFFESGLRRTFRQFATIQDCEYPATIYYAFKQAETEICGDGQSQTASTGWETMLEGLISSGFQITATWPMRTELANRMIAENTNALASSIVLACRVRGEAAPQISRQQFLRELREKLAADLRPLQQASLAPVDLAQAAIGPGMAIYSQYRRVREASGEALRVREALALINQVLDEVLAEQDEEYDSATGWAVSWYEQYGMNDGPFGDADNLARARNVAVEELAHDGVVRSGRSKVRFVWREEYPDLPPHWHPTDDDISDWAIMQRLAQAIQAGQAQSAAVKAHIDAALPGRTELARDLAYRAFNIADRKGWTRESLVYNTLVQNWPEMERLASELAPSDVQMQMFGEKELGKRN